MYKVEWKLGDKVTQVTYLSESDQDTEWLRQYILDVKQGMHPLRSLVVTELAEVHKATYVPKNPMPLMEGMI